jgi:hypothetical protein
LHGAASDHPAARNASAICSRDPTNIKLIRSDGRWFEGSVVRSGRVVKIPSSESRSVSDSRRGASSGSCCARAGSASVNVSDSSTPGLK